MMGRRADSPAHRYRGPSFRRLRSIKLNRVSPYVLAVGLAAVLATPGRSGAQVSTDLIVGSRVEWAVEKLVGFGLIDDRIVGIRPWSRTQARRLLAQARANLDRLERGDREAAERILSAASDDRSGRESWVDLSGDATFLDSPWAPVPSETGADKIDAEVNHLVRYRGGREYVDGQTWAAELSAGTVLGKYVSVEARPRVWITHGADISTDVEGELLEGQIRFQLRGLRLDFGRLRSVWGPGRNGGTLLANNARGLDGVRLSNDAPFHWPGFLSVLGPSQGEIFFARLESDRDIPHSALVGYTISIHPHRLVEASASALIQSGGEGAPRASFGDRFLDHLLFVDWIFNRESDFLFSNKASSIALRIRIPALRNTQVFAEHTIEDPALNFRRMFWQDAGWLAGFWVPRLDRAGTFDLRAELHHGGVRLHRHGQFTSGRTLDHLMIGMGGPDTWGGFVEVTAEKENNGLSLEVGVENRSADKWRVLAREDGSINVWDKIEDGPDELSLRGVGTFRTIDKQGREIRLRIGLEQVYDSFFVAGAKRLNAIVQLDAFVPLWSPRVRLSRN